MAADSGQHFRRNVFAAHLFADAAACCRYAFTAFGLCGDEYDHLRLQKYKEIFQISPDRVCGIFYIKRNSSSGDVAV